MKTLATKIGCCLRVREILLTAFFSLMFIAVLPADEPRSEHQVYFEKTDYELHVYRIFGREPGKTILIIGGIHGNEPGSYLAADKYVDLTLHRGNLIIVPRANLLSILTKDRGVTGDYNRKFNAKLKSDRYDDQVVKILKQLIKESDVLLNLHDGSGFFRTKYIDALHNPYRFGQSIIVDCEEYEVGEQNLTLELGKAARWIVAQINSRITNPEYHFHFSNHDSVSPDTRYPEMRRTATYFALTEFNIPAFGIETSKSLPTTEMRVAHQLMAINAFLEYYGVEVDVPGRSVSEPRLDYAVVTINEEEALVVRNNETLKVRSGDRIRIDHLVGNYERLLIADIVGFGERNDNGREVRVTRPLSVKVRKDADVCGTFRIVPHGDGAEAAEPLQATTTKHFVMEVNGHRIVVPDGGVLEVVRGDKLRILDYLAPGVPRGINVNFLGFVGNPENNRGEDRGYLIDTCKDLLPDWSVDKQGKRYAVATKLGNREFARMIVKIMEPELDYVVVSLNQEHPIVLKAGEKRNLRPGDRLVILASISNAPDNNSLCYFLRNATGVIQAVDGNSFVADSANLGGILTLCVMRSDVEMGSVSFLLSHSSKDETVSARR